MARTGICEASMTRPPQVCQPSIVPNMGMGAGNARQFRGFVRQHIFRPVKLSGEIWCGTEHPSFALHGGHHGDKRCIRSVHLVATVRNVHFPAGKKSEEAGQPKQGAGRF